MSCDVATIECTCINDMDTDSIVIVSTITRRLNMIADLVQAQKPMLPPVEPQLAQHLPKLTDQNVHTVSVRRVATISLFYSREFTEA